METERNIKEVFERYLANEYSVADFKIIQEHFQKDVEREKLCLLIEAELDKENDTSNDEVRIDKILNKVDQRVRSAMHEKSEVKSVPLYRTKFFRIAASLFMIAGLAYFFFMADHKLTDDQSTITKDIQPGGNNATLTLSNGSIVDLNAQGKGVIDGQNGVTISKLNDGELAYSKTGASSEIKVEYNTFTTPMGGEYQVRLPDGSKVWLNAASSITYATSLNERGERWVKLESGEAYFEIAKDRKHPFIVKTAGQEVEVLGTHFNISAYSDESKIKTTLVEGSIKITTLGKSKILKPNQQALVDSRNLIVDEVDPEIALAWKNGFFIFDSENLESVMLKIARWYNVEVIYEDPTLKSKTILGTMSRYDKISKVLKVLDRTKVAVFELDGKVVRVRKKK